MNKLFLSLCVLLSLISIEARSEANPNLMLTHTAVGELRSNLGKAPLLDASYEQAIQELVPFLAAPADVPFPKDAGGGYTHEVHKKNGQAIAQAGFLFQISGDEKYLAVAKDLLLRYAVLYPTLGKHPEHKHQSPGKLFWQILNDAVWLVYAIQGYDAILPALTQAERKAIETQLLRPYVNFLSIESEETFSKIHNHGTWAAAAVGMTGLVLKDQSMVDISLKGLSKDGSSGFLKQLDMLFSPDGYYTEGPYYQRYALMPFLVFARALDNNNPSYKIFAYRDSVLLKAIYASINLSYNNLFFPLNDAIKDKGLDTIEMVYGVDIAYALTGDTGLLSLAKNQGQVLLSGDGQAVASAIAEGKATDFNFTSQLLRDGPSGSDGGVAILRGKNSALVFKAASQGMGHGHFDRLSWLYYDNGAEIVGDYGAARFLNVVTKRGGIYLPENDTWAKQTVAHNTLVVDGLSHFNGNMEAASKSSSIIQGFSAEPGLQWASATEAHAYKGVQMQRTLIMAEPKALTKPLIIDVFNVQSTHKHQYDLPVHYRGQITYLNTAPKVALNKLVPVGKANGYEHLWQKGVLKPDAHTSQLTWLEGNRFYSSTLTVPKGASVVLAELGANDPEFNLRRENSFMLRTPKMADANLVSVLESHGEYNGVREYTLQPKSKVAKVTQDQQPGYQIVVIHFVDGGRYTLLLADDMQTDKTHTLTVQGQSVTWQGAITSIEEMADGSAK